jgi:hypothetical protein
MSNKAQFFFFFAEKARIIGPNPQKKARCKLHLVPHRGGCGGVQAA